ncbi:agmatinase [Aureitalea marina]|uniref:Agmatinase n=1 Tax=Aureitalea marina TaxID=930804 RepID=A0A2S7KRZ2_9FLAO|nr:agmatinase [Aureitalea marina]PQB05380.1 agmatinase [Aureitalea marina]
MSKIIVQGIAYDAKSSFLKGPAKGPAGIRQALGSGSMNLCAEDGTNLESLDITDLGDFHLSDYHQILETSRENLAKGEKLFSLGGDHSVTYPIVKAHFEAGLKFDLLHIDAHTDLYEDYEGDRFSHACPMARIMEEGLVGRMVQVGIRTLSPHQQKQAARFGVEIHEMRHKYDWPELKFDRPIYITLDMDALDPAFAPGVSHHEPGGFSTRELIRLIQNLDVELVGCDLVEYNPERDIDQRTAYLGAKLFKELMAKLVK